MGEAQQDHQGRQDEPIRPTFNSAVRIEARRERLTADAGVLMLRELMERTGLIEWLDEHFIDPRNPELITHPMAELLRTALTLLADRFRSRFAHGQTAVRLMFLGEKLAGSVVHELSRVAIGRTALILDHLAYVSVDPALQGKGRSAEAQADGSLPLIRVARSSASIPSAAASTRITRIFRWR